MYKFLRLKLPNFGWLVVFNGSMVLCAKIFSNCYFNIRYQRNQSNCKPEWLIGDKPGPSIKLDRVLKVYYVQEFQVPLQL